MRRRADSGQATVEWIGLVLGLALAFGGALGAARGADFSGEADGLGEALAQRMTCAARGECGAGPGGAELGGGGRLRDERRAPRGHRLRARPPRPHRLPARPPRPPGAFVGRGTPPWAPLGRRAWALKGVGAGALRALGRAGRFAWPICLGVRRLRYELDHPRTPRQGIPARDSLALLNKCLNPWAFLVP